MSKQLHFATKKHSRLQVNNTEELDALARKYGTDKSHLFNGYVHHYENHFSSLKNKPINLLELGVHNGYSHRMWKEYFQNGTIYGIDNNEQSKDVQEERIVINIGSLDDQDFVSLYLSTAPKFDIIVDDASHTMEQQKSNFINFFPHVKSGGVYVVEDLGTSYWHKWNGGYRNKNTMVEFLKDLVDCPNYEAFKKSNDFATFGSFAFEEPPSYYDLNIYSIHFYKYICFVDKTDE